MVIYTESFANLLLFGIFCLTRGGGREFQGEIVDSSWRIMGYELCIMGSQMNYGICIMNYGNFEFLHNHNTHFIIHAPS